MTPAALGTDMPEACAGGWCDHEACELTWWVAFLGCTKAEAREHIEWMKTNLKEDA